MADRTFCEWGEFLTMAEYMTNDIDLTKVANAIRNVSETEEALSYPDGFVAAANEAANKFLRLDGSKTMTGALDMGSQRITNVGAPTADDDAVRKADLDEKITDPTTKENGQVLTYNETTGAWEAGTPAAGGMTQTEADARYLKLSGSGDVQVSGYDIISFDLNEGFALQGMELGSYITADQNGIIKIGVSDNEAFKCDNNTTYVTSRQTKGVHISNLADPTANTDAVNKNYVDTKVANYLPLTGGNVTGNVSFGDGLTTIVGSSGAINIKNLDETTTASLFTQDKTFIISNPNGNVSIRDLRAPTLDNEATPKSYVDQYAPHATLVTLTVAGWNSTSKTQTVTVSGILADESKQLIIPMPAVASMTAYNDAGIQCTGQAANRLTFTATTVPTAAISVYVTYQTVIS